MLCPIQTLEVFRFRVVAKGNIHETVPATIRYSANLEIPSTDTDTDFYDIDGALRVITSVNNKLWVLVVL